MAPHLAYLCSSVSWGGLEMNQLRNAGWMMKRGHAVLMVCREGSPVAAACISEGIPTAFISGHRKYYDFKAGKRLALLLDKNRITHLIVRDTRDMSVSVIAKRKAQHSVHLSYFMEMQLGVTKKGLPHTLRFLYFDAWCCPLNWLADQVRTMTRFDHNRIHVIPSGLELSCFTTGISKEEARRKLELPAHAKIIGLSGRFDPQKGQLLLLEAARSAQHKDFVICFLGEPTKGEGVTYSEKMMAFITENDLNDRVYIRPFRKEIEVFYAAIDVFVMASKAETFGMVTIEAMASGVPVIASNSGGSPEILQKGALGMLFEPMNAGSLSATIDRFFSSEPFTAEQLRKAAEYYDHNSVCASVEQVLELNNTQRHQ